MDGFQCSYPVYFRPVALELIALLKKGFLLISITSLALILSACASPNNTSYNLKKSSIEAERTRQYQQALTYQLSQRVRLAEVSLPLLESSVKDCPKSTQYSLGIFLHNLDSYETRQQPAAKALYELTKTPQILHSLSKGASANKLMAHDQMLLINGKKVPKNIRKTNLLIKQELSSGDPVNVTVLRKNRSQNISITPRKICAYPIIYSNSDTINGYADGSNIIITAGLIRFAKKDNQLALIIAHEMAHNTLQHIQQRLSNIAIGSLIDIAFISSGVFSPFVGAGLAGNLYTQSYEIEADLEGIRLMHQAGLDINGLDDFWRKMAEIHPASISQGREISHPTTVERSLLIQETIKQLLSKNNKIDHQLPSF